MPITKEDSDAMRELALGLTNDAKGIRVTSDPEPGWLLAEFAMPTEPQYKALPKIERDVRIKAWRRWDWTVSFPATEAERQRAERRNALARRRRKAKRIPPPSGRPPQGDDRTN